MKSPNSRPSIPILLLFLAGCSRNPSLEISGSFFPAWMLSIIIGLIGAFVGKRIFVRMGVDAYLKPHLLVYGALFLGLTLLTWLLLYL
jgi:uncharacterized membrane protein YeaQ/YmgE (transglycosylase-associated protein family)